MRKFHILPLQTSDEDVVHGNEKHHGYFIILYTHSTSRTENESITGMSITHLENSGRLIDRLKSNTRVTTDYLDILIISVLRFFCSK